MKVKISELRVGDCFEQGGVNYRVLSKPLFKKLFPDVPKILLDKAVLLSASFSSKLGILEKQMHFKWQELFKDSKKNWKNTEVEKITLSRPVGAESKNPRVKAASGKGAAK